MFGLGQKGVVRVGGTVQNTLKGGGTEKRGGGNKDLKKGASWGGEKGGGGAGTLLRTMDLSSGLVE